MLAADSPSDHERSQPRRKPMPTPLNAIRTSVDPARRGYHALYRGNEVNRCPGCGRTHWIIGRVLAECGFCATALPLS
jgi:hypothetical protein